MQASKLEGKLTVSCPMGRKRDTITLSVKDTRSGVEFLEITLSPHDFALALTGQGLMPCELEVRGLELVGTQRERKTVDVPLPLDRERDEDVGNPLAPFEVDGWMGNADDLHNPHRRNYPAGTAQVNFIRYVNPETGEPVAPAPAPLSPCCEGRR